MVQVMSRDGARILDGAESARQRLADALRIRRGTYPWLRDYGSLLDDLVDRNVDSGFEARVYANVAETVAHPPNGLADIRLREVRLHQDGDNPDRVEIEVFADWIAPDGSVGEIGLRQALAQAPPVASTLYTATPVGLHTIDVTTGATARVGSAEDYGLDAAIAPTSLAWDGRLMWMTAATPGRLYQVNRADGTAVRVPGPDDFGVGESQPEAMTWAAWRLLMLGDDLDALWQVDRVTGRASRVHDVDRFGIGEHQPDGLAWDGWRLWMAGGINDALHRLDARLGHAIRAGTSHRFGQDLDGGGELAWDARRLLMLRESAMLYTLDRETGAAAPLVAVQGLDGDAGGLVWAPEAEA
ncbi:MAG: hypothetical protein OXK73_08005 [Rhodospirillaceae bacterium]|nr:hypothetical protein [Rhodospirillaceae bacterium]